MFQCWQVVLCMHPYQVYTLHSMQAKSTTLQMNGHWPVSIQYKYLVPIYVFPEMKLFFPKQNYNVLNPSSYTHISVRDLYISGISLPILLQGNKWTDPGMYKSLSDT